MPSITLPFSASGLEAASTPSTASRFGAEKISSVGMFATKRTPLFAVSAPAIQTCSSGSPTTTSVPSAFLYRTCLSCKAFSLPAISSKYAQCARHASTASPPSVTRIALKIASHSFSIAASSASFGKTFFAQFSTGTLTTHHGKPFAIIVRWNSFWSRPVAASQRRSLSVDTPRRFSGSLAEMEMKPAPSCPSCTFFSMSHGYIASNTLSSACSQCSRLQTSSRHSITTSFAPSSKQAAQSARPKSAQSTGQRTTTVCPFCTLMPTPATNCAYCFNSSFFMFSPASVFGLKGRPFRFFPSKRRTARPPRLRSPSIVHSFA